MFVGTSAGQFHIIGGFNHCFTIFPVPCLLAEKLGTTHCKGVLRIFQPL